MQHSNCDGGADVENAQSQEDADHTQGRQTQHTQLADEQLGSDGELATGNAVHKQHTQLADEQLGSDGELSTGNAAHKQHTQLADEQLGSDGELSTGNAAHKSPFKPLVVSLQDGDGQEKQTQQTQMAGQQVASDGEVATDTAARESPLNHIVISLSDANDTQARSAQQTQLASQQVASDGRVATDTAARKRPFKQIVVSLSVFAIWCVILRVAVAPPPGRGFGFTTTINEGIFFPIFLGLLIGLQGLGKILDPFGYVEAVKAFRIRRVPPRTIAVFFIGVELYTGPAMMMGSLAADFGALFTLSGIGACLDIVGYVVLTLSAYVHGYAFSWNHTCNRADGQCVTNCTYFGTYSAQKLSIWVLLQNAIVVVETMFVTARIFGRSCIWLNCSEEQ